MPKDKLDEFGDIVQDLLKLVDEELDAIRWRQTFKPEKQSENHWLAHREEMLQNGKARLIARLVTLAAE